MRDYRKQAFWAIICFVVIQLAGTASAYGSDMAGGQGLADGPGVWVNMWHYPQSDFDAYCQNLHSKGIRNLFLQTSRSNTEAVVNKELLGPIIEACHRYKIRVIAWSFAELWNPQADADRLVAAARFQSPNGHRIDAIAPNLEKDLSLPKVDAYTKRLRAELGSSYPMIAVVYSPLNKAPQVANIPWRHLSQHYDVLAPMNYWNSKYQKLDPYEYTVGTIKKVRELTGRQDVEIHVIGDGMGTRPDSISRFMKACQDMGATSASLYPNHKITQEQLDCIAMYADYFPVNSRFRLAAYRELVKSGVLDVPPGHDPHSPINRGEFYKLLVKQLVRGPVTRHMPVPQVLTPDSASAYLANLGVVHKPQLLTGLGSLERALMGPLSHREAVSLTACVLESVTRAGKKAGRADQWFIQPVRAEPLQVDNPKGKPLTWLDAAQLVLQASSGLM